ncbi:MAG: cytochrome c [Opitutaceae bacterium]|nr:cytochrome c [Opitutaceae bacterium]
MKTHTKLFLASVGFMIGAGLSVAAPVQENWDNHCAKCHGADGKGDTKVGKKLKLKDYTDAAAQATFTDEEIVKITAEGYADEKGKQTMKGFADKLSPEEIQEFVAFIRAFKG